MTSPTILLLGESEELAAAFRRLGAHVHIAPAEVAGDGEAVRGIVDKQGVDHVVPLTAHVDVAALQALEEAGISVTPSAQGCRLTVERDSLRTVATEELGLPTTAYRFADTREEFAEAVAEMGFPCIVKPETFGSGHRVLRSPEDAQWHDRRVMVERFIDFDHELTLLAVRSIDPGTGELATWFCAPVGHTHSGGELAEAWQPMEVNQVALENARSLAARITNALGGQGLFAVEMFVAGEDVYFSAVTPRPHDSGAVTLCTQRFSQWDLHARAILGLPIDTTLVSPGACTVIREDLDLARALSVPESDVRHYTDFPPLALATADTVDQARDRAVQVAASTIG
ncbi:MAG: ATP-grasp domain-containing protein [Corynebacterium sp.]|uniref:ATP-grasp domain-containing protein n=1 Tax=Corynebacterium sp. TaxID=1720 RepID=UPI0026E10C56|nr:ATP-grasp domain-containing protein [Corynebacterium sp.]MDO5669345.1 ATP-grasp domain-containing protein [Corynebacterium sp.]